MPRKERPARQLYRCITDCAVQSIKHEYSRAFGRGAIVDMSEQVAEGVTLGDLLGDVMARGTFEAFREETAPAAVAPDEGSVNDGA